jgi:hypothetical protein
VADGVGDAGIVGVKLAVRDGVEDLVGDEVADWVGVIETVSVDEEVAVHDIVGIGGGVKVDVADNVNV